MEGPRAKFKLSLAYFLLSLVLSLKAAISCWRTCGGEMFPSVICLQVTGNERCTVGKMIHLGWGLLRLGSYSQDWSTLKRERMGCWVKRKEERHWANLSDLFAKEATTTAKMVAFLSAIRPTLLCGWSQPLPGPSQFTWTHYSYVGMWTPTPRAGEVTLFCDALRPSPRN